MRQAVVVRKLTPQRRQSMANLARAIEWEHAAALTSVRSALAHAHRAGNLLLQAKSKLPHGKWSSWLKKNCPQISERSAQGYMRVAERWPELRSKAQRVSDLPLRKALALLAAPAQKNDPEPSVGTNEEQLPLPLDGAGVPPLSEARRRWIARERAVAALQAEITTKAPTMKLDDQLTALITTQLAADAPRYCEGKPSLITAVAKACGIDLGEIEATQLRNLK